MPIKTPFIWDFGGPLFCNATSDLPDFGWVTTWEGLLSIWSETSLWYQGLSFLELSEMPSKTGWIWDFGGLLFCNATSDLPDFGWVTTWEGLLSIWSETSLWYQGLSFLELSEMPSKTGWIWDFGGLLFCNATSDLPDFGWVTTWEGLLSIWSETSLWYQGLSFLELSEMPSKTGWIWDFGGLLFCNATSDLPDFGWVTTWEGLLSIWSETSLW